MKRRETSMNEMEQMLLATRRLLSVLCDSCEQLTHEWEVIDPSPPLLELLGIEDTKCSTLPFLHFISEEDQERFATFGANGTDTPSSLHVRMQTRAGQGFNARIFLVNLPVSLSSGRLVGIARDEMVTIPEHRSLHEMQFRRPAHMGPSSSSASKASSSSCSELKEAFNIAEIEQMALVLDLKTMSEGYRVRSLELFFKELDRKRLPRLYKWVKRRDQPTVEDWIQEHVNSWYRGQATFQERCNGMKVKIPGISNAFVVGEMSAVGIASERAREGQEDEDYSMLMKIGLRNLVAAS